jgi:hypothetical protein
MTRPIFIVHLRPEPHCLDDVKASRGVLKRSLRDCEMKCVTIQTTDSVGFVLPEGEA